jgi:L,D-transpeptidase catalytic domain
MRRSVQLLISGVLCAIFGSSLSGNGAANAEARTGARLSSTINTAVAEAAGVSPDVLKLAASAVSCAVASGDIFRPPTLTLIDYSRPSTEPRLWVFNATSGELLFKELVAHGRNTGDNYAKHFSDAADSLQSSLGLFVTRGTYVGSNGYSLRLDGLEPGFNAHAWDRAIVMHGAPYVDAAVAARQGRLGRSWGCPALRDAIARRVIDTVRDGGVIFSYYPDSDWLKTSRFLNGCGAASIIAATN